MIVALDLYLFVQAIITIVALDLSGYYYNSST